MYGTFTARNVIGEQHESGEQVYDTVRNVLESASFFLSFSRPNPSRASRARKKEQENNKRKLSMCGTYTARNVMREQHELG